MNCECTRPISDEAKICWTCAESLGRTLRALGELTGELAAARTRQVKFGDGGKTSGESPLPYDDRAGRAHAKVRELALDWSKRFACFGTTRDVFECLAESVAILRMQDDAPEIKSRAEKLAEQVAGAVDRPPEARYAGPCTSCGKDLLVIGGASTVACAGCEEQYVVSDHMRWLKDQVEDRLMTAAELVVYLRFSGYTVTDSRVRTWASRGRLVRAYSEEPARYRVGDALRLLDLSG